MAMQCKTLLTVGKTVKANMAVQCKTLQTAGKTAKVLPAGFLERSKSLLFSVAGEQMGRGYK